MRKDKVKKILDELKREYPDAECALNHRNIYELIVAVALSAQTTDKSVNEATPALFKKYNTPLKLAKASPEDVEPYIRRIGMYKTKSKNIVGLAKALVDKYNGEVPNDYDALVSLPGVGRKTANVVLSVGFGEQRIAVDTHVFRVSNRIGLVHESDVLKTEEGLMRIVPHDRWSESHHSLIFHGRNCCHARKPNCDGCCISKLCEKNNL
ncbi:MAG: endonuclease III [Firmicutes bacterium]|nr:endonuclease III [Bacillota bacterium]